MTLAIVLPMPQLRAITSVIESLEVLEVHGTVFTVSIGATLGDVQVHITNDQETGDFAVELSTAVEEPVEEPQHAKGLSPQLRDVIATPYTPSA